VSDQEQKKLLEEKEAEEIIKRLMMTADEIQMKKIFDDLKALAIHVRKSYKK
jgi:hypothetical protein